LFSNLAGISLELNANSWGRGLLARHIARKITRLSRRGRAVVCHLGQLIERRGGVFADPGGFPMRHLDMLVCAAAMALGAGSASAQSTRTWVSGVGDDVNPCSRTAPCKTLPGAISKTAAGGEISVLDPGGFGAVTITKSIFINGMWGGEAGVLAGGNAITVNAGPNDVVVLSGLMIVGVSPPYNGVKYLAGGSLHIRDSIIKNFNAANSFGILVAPTAGALKLTVSNTLIENNGNSLTGGGISIAPTGAATVKATLTRTQVINNVVGVSVDGDNGTGAIDLTVRDTDVSGNSTQGLVSKSPNAGDALIRIGIADSTVASNGGIGVQSVGQKSTVRIGSSIVNGNLAAGLQANNGGVLQSYGDNYTDGNGSANVGVTAATPN
jgi:hypothetical protein